MGRISLFCLVVSNQNQHSGGGATEWKCGGGSENTQSTWKHREVPLAAGTPLSVDVKRTKWLDGQFKLQSGMQRRSHINHIAWFRYLGIESPHPGNQGQYLSVLICQRRLTVSDGLDQSKVRRSPETKIGQLLSTCGAGEDGRPMRTLLLKPHLHDGCATLRLSRSNLHGPSTMLLILGSTPWLLGQFSKRATARRDRKGMNSLNGHHNRNSVFAGTQQKSIMSLYRIGVDVGGTNTDAALLDITAADTPSHGVLASHKASTTADITSGIEAAIREVMKSSAIDQNKVLSVTIGTTHFINALVEADTRRLSRVAVIRLCGPFTRQIPPFSDFPSGLRRILDGGAYYLDGGLEIDGREVAPLDHQQIREAVREVVAADVTAIAIVGIFAPLDHAGVHEETCKRIILEEAPELDVVCSHDIGPPGLLERENATILNAAILKTAQKVTRGFKRAMARLRLECPLYLSQNDGTLIDADTAAEYPIKTFASGPTNSMTGAAFLAGLDKIKTVVTDPADVAGDETVEPQVLVVDIGGTTTDVCALLPSGFPRQAPGFVEVGGVRTAFSMPEVVSIGLGGGSKVDVQSESGDVTVGPGSVGHFLTEQARIFGGSTLTASDIVVASGKVQLGDAGLVQDLPNATIEKAKYRIKRMLEGVIEKMKVSSAPVFVLLVGGGALLVTDDLDGVEKCIQPIHQGAANAVGAAIGKVSGEVDVIEILEGRDEKAVVSATCQKAIDIAIQKGAAPDDVRIVEVNKMPLQYVDNGAMRIQVRAVGKLCVPDSPVFPEQSNGILAEEEQESEGVKDSVFDALESTTKPSLKVDLESYRPNVRNGVWYVSEVDLELISTGCGVLGTGGGGPTHHEFLKSLQALRTSEAGKMRIISPKALGDDDMVCFGSWYGTPSVINERIAGGTEIPNGIDAVTKILGIKSLDGIFIDEM